MKNQKKKGFTIVELVIVIAVIGVLAAVLIPTFSGVMNAANNSAALQEARNAFTNYCAVSDVYVDVPAEDRDYVVEVTANTAADGAQANGQYLIVVDGQIQEEVYASKALALAAFANKDPDDTTNGQVAETGTASESCTVYAVEAAASN